MNQYSRKIYGLWDKPHDEYLLKFNKRLYILIFTYLPVPGSNDLLSIDKWEGLAS